MKAKVSCWIVTTKDGSRPIRANSWEVAFSLDGKDCHTVTFSGPEARKLAEAYKSYMEAFLAADSLLA